MSAEPGKPSTTSRFTPPQPGWRERLDFATLRFHAAFDDAPRPASEKQAALVAPGVVAPGVTVLGRYKLQSILGEGGFGRVWRATDEKEGKDVALKQLLAEGFGGEQLEQEFAALARLKHPNIVSVSDYGELPDKSRFLVMELVPGRDVAEMLRAGPLPRDVALRILLQLTQALQLLHSRLYVHCDIKAENIRLSDKNVTKLMDFGLLHQLGTPASNAQGTPQYMAPEMATAGVIDARTDLYAVGVLAYEMLTGQLPFNGASVQELIRQHLTEAPRPPSYYLDLPKVVDDVVLKLLEKDPEKRFAGGGELSRALSEILGEPVQQAEKVTHRTSYLYSAALIGRDRERAQLAAVRDGLRDKKGAFLFVGGRGGEGKTRLLDEFKVSVKLGRTPWAQGQCRPTGLPPLAPLGAALGSLVSRTPPELVKEIGPALAGFVPGFKELGVEEAHFHDAAQAKVVMYQAATQWLRALAAQQPFVLCVEDLHWADGATVDMLNQLVRSLQDAPVVILATFRTNEVDKTSMVYATVHEKKSVLLDLPPLDEKAVDDLLRACLRGLVPPADFRARLFAATRGNAFAVIETLRALVEAGALLPEEGSWKLVDPNVALPESLSDVVMRRLEHTPADLAALLRTLAPMGRQIDLELLRTVSGKTADALQPLLDELVERQFVIRERQTYGFAHETVRAGVYEHSAPDEKKRLHQKIGDALATRDASPGEIAYHFKRGDAPMRSVDFFLKAAKQALGMQQPNEAVKLLNEGVSVLETTTNAPRDMLVAFYDLLGVTSFRAHPPSCVKAVDALTALWSKEIDPDQTVARIRTRAARIQKLPAPIKKLFPPPPPPGPDFDPKTRDPGAILNRMLMLHAQEAMALASLGEVDRSLSLLDTIMARLPSPMSPLPAICSVPRLVANIHTGRTNVVIETARRTIEALDRFPGEMPPPLKFAYWFNHYAWGVAEALAGIQLTQAVADKSLGIAKAMGDVQSLAFALLPRFMQASFQGVPGPFESLAAEMEDISHRLGWPQPLSSRLTLWAPIYFLNRQELDRADASIERIAGFARATRDGWLDTYAKVFLGMLQHGRGEDALADKTLADATASALARKLGRAALALFAHAEVKHSLGDAAGARDVVEKGLERGLSKDLGSPYDEMVGLRVRGVIVGGDSGEADLSRARDTARAQKHIVQEAHALVALAQLRAREGRGDVLVPAGEAAALYESVQNHAGVSRARGIRERAA